VDPHPERMERMQQTLPQAVQVSMVGMTESAGSICIGSVTDSLYSRMHTSGRPLRGMEVRVINPATGEECPRGVPGEPLFRGVTRFIEYYRDPAVTANVIDDDVASISTLPRIGTVLRRSTIPCARLSPLNKAVRPIISSIQKPLFLLGSRSL